jgi:hypothetical protein
MSHDIKYIGMDVHKEATVIAVLIIIVKWRLFQQLTSLG